MSAIDQPRIERAVREILTAIGENPNREVMRDTPERVAQAYAYLFGGLHEDPARYLDVSFAGEEFTDPVMLRDIPLASLCEHHLLPFIGTAHVGYLPDRRVVGLSEIVKVVEGYARRPQVQERLTAQISDALYGALGSRGSIVVIEAEHTCMTMRGSEKPGTITVTQAARGAYADDAALRAEFLAHASRH